MFPISDDILAHFCRPRKIKDPGKAESGSKAWSAPAGKKKSPATSRLHETMIETEDVRNENGRPRVFWGRNTSLVLLLLLCMMVSILPVAKGLIVQRSFTTTSYITVFQKFAFDSNGTVHFEKTTFHPPSDSVRAFFYLCDTRQWTAFVSMATDAPEKLCQSKMNPSNSSVSIFLFTLLFSLNTKRTCLDYRINCYLPSPNRECLFSEVAQYRKFTSTIRF